MHDATSMIATGGRGDFFACESGPPITGVTRDGSYGDYLLASAGALARVPEGLPPVEAAPLLCAGLTSFNALRNSPARAGDLVAILGLGGLVHRGVQFASKMGYRTVAIARGKDKEPLALKPGARHAGEAYGRMMSGKARFRVVLNTGH